MSIAYTPTTYHSILENFHTTNLFQVAGFGKHFLLQATYNLLKASPLTYMLFIGIKRNVPASIEIGNAATVIPTKALHSTIRCIHGSVA